MTKSILQQLDEAEKRSVPPVDIYHPDCVEYLCMLVENGRALIDCALALEYYADIDNYGLDGSVDGLTDVASKALAKLYGEAESK